MIEMLISICPFQNGEFDVMIKDPETGEELVLTGNQRLTDEQLEIANKFAPSCVFTHYIQREGQ